MQFSPLQPGMGPTRQTDEYPAQRPRRPALDRHSEPLTSPGRFADCPEEEDLQRSSVPAARHARFEEAQVIHPARRNVLLQIGLATLGVAASSVGTYALVTRQPQYTYGTIPTAWTKGVVGHNNDSASSPSVFMSVNYQGQVIVQEFPAGDLSKGVVYQLGTVDDPSVPVTLTFDEGEHPSMVVQVGRNVRRYHNDGSRFQLPKNQSPNLNQ
jgi:hypothetical protein